MYLSISKITHFKNYLITVRGVSVICYFPPLRTTDAGLHAMTKAACVCLVFSLPEYCSLHVHDMSACWDAPTLRQHCLGDVCLCVWSHLIFRTALCTWMYFPSTLNFRSDVSGLSNSFFRDSATVRKSSCSTDKQTGSDVTSKSGGSGSLQRLPTNICRSARWSWVRVMSMCGGV